MGVRSRKSKADNRRRPKLQTLIESGYFVFLPFSRIGLLTGRDFDGNWLNRILWPEWNALLVFGHSVGGIRGRLVFLRTQKQLVRSATQT
jgi:hypothetical protein